MKKIYYGDKDHLGNSNIECEVEVLDVHNIEKTDFNYMFLNLFKKIKEEDKIYLIRKKVINSNISSKKSSFKIFKKILKEIEVECALKDRKRQGRSYLISVLPESEVNSRLLDRYGLTKVVIELEGLVGITKQVI